MNISEVNLNPSHRSDVRRNDGAGTADQADSSAKGAAPTRSADVADRVEISESARRASEARGSTDLERARQALDGIPTLSTRRVDELMNRIKSGFYQDSSVVEQVAKRAGQELASGGI